MYSSYRRFSKHFKNTERASLFFTAILTAIASEIKVIPFSEEAFRFGLGSITFFLLILIRTPTSFVRTGLITGITVVCFRLFGDTIIDSTPFWISLKSHLPAFLFYFLFALGFGMIKIEKYKTSPLLLGVLAAGLEFIGNSAEHLMRYWLLIHKNVGFQEWTLLAGVALLRSYFVVGLYSSITVTEQKKRLQEMLEVGSELYAETLYLQKSMDHIEQITASSHDLYRKLKKKDLQDLSIQALLITQEIHEVKKDSQRILSGISKISIQNNKDVFSLSDVLHFVVTANEKYCKLLGKATTVTLLMHTDFETDQQVPLLALLNNLVANAVESITNNGHVDIHIFEELTYTHFVIKDSGKGIPSEDFSIIFEPGYTTKFNDQGVASTGIGLSHVREIVQTLEGSIQVNSSNDGTTFHVQIPTKNIRKGAE
ncbi:ATP-binding protein [Bacillus sp. FJAT-50079]|uniref:ATP-binding protein n=1 Tax=Bacillus sp. FJAT-50079 TaxID=2833577 RepID=UPI001BCA5F19|nr:ATP-binding protein [Bacillus sp. FJAT-50079]MBS4209135.1 ATP-binding protein [Bacillus sp. FJAT-50079]